MGNGVLDAEEDAAQVDVEHARELVVAALVEHLVFFNRTGVVVDDIQPAEMSGGAGEHALHVRAAGSIGANRDRLAAVGRDLRRSLLRRRRVYVNRSDGGAFGSEQKRRGLAHPRTGPGDYRYLVGQSHSPTSASFDSAVRAATC